MRGPRIRQGDSILLSIASSVAVTNTQGRVDFLGDDGIDYTLKIPQFTTNSDRITQNLPTNEKAPVDGEIYAAYVSAIGTPARGQTPANLQVVSGDLIKYELCKGYLSPLGGLALGEFGIRGPAGGHGSLELLTIASNVAGNTDTTLALAATNTYRKVYGVALYYNRAVDVEDVIPNIDLVSQPWGALPTGFAATVPLAYTLTGPSLQSTQEGFMWVYGRDGSDGYAITQDNGAGLVTANAASSPVPFPYIVQEGDPIDVRIRITDGDASDVYSAYALVEDWVMG